MLFFCLLLLIILEKLAYYSSLVYPLFQFKDIIFILKRQFLWLDWLQKVKYNPLVWSFAFEKKSFPTISAAADEGCTSNNNLHASATQSDDLSTT